jgi:glycosyltransferase involved in cell wall biosynthesis
VWMCNEPPLWFFIPEQRRGLRKINWPLFELLDKAVVNYVDEIMVLSHVSEEHVRRAYNRSSRVVRTGVDVEVFHNANGENVRRKYGFENSFVLLFVGGSVYARRVDAIRALYILSKKYDNVRLILDTERELETLTRLSEKLGVRNKVLLVHSTSDAELAELYAACDAFVYPSAESTWGLVVTEAMAASKPVIVSKQVGTSEIIQDHTNGIVIEWANPEEIAKQVEILMDNPKLRKKLGENAYEYVKNNLSWSRYAESVETVFQETLLRSKDK